MRMRLRDTAGGCIAAIVAVLLVCAPAAVAAVPAHGRAWEILTAGPTNGVRMLGERAWSVDGDRVVLTTVSPLPGSPSGDLAAHALATRTATGWSTQPIGEPFTTPKTDFFTSGPVAVSADLSSWLWLSSQPLLPGAPPASNEGLYIRRPDGTLELLGAAGDVKDFAFAGASDDASHAVFQSQAHLLPADAGRTSGGDVYELAGTELRIVDVDSGGTPISACGSEVGDGTAESTGPMHAVSRDGTRIFFSAPATEGCGQPRGVYVRENGSQTTEISASACTRADCDAPQDTSFAGALPDGSSAFLITAQQLTNDDTDESADLYRYDLADHLLTRISAGPPGIAADVSGPVVRASDDGGRVYFLASGALVPGQGVPGSPNLYLWDHGRLRFVATAGDINLGTAAITADGRTLMFATSAPLTPTDTDSDTDVYRYDAATGTLQELSIGTDGRGNGDFPVTFGQAGNVASLEQDPLRYMSTDGKRAFFLTNEALVPEDVNQASDVYEWADGNVGLITSGTGDGNVTYGGVSADGRSVFFSTDQSLLPADRNNGDDDLYDARLGGGFPNPPPPVPECEGDGCQGPATGRLARPTPASVAYDQPPAPPLFRIRALDRHARDALAATGRVTITVDVPLAGRVSVIAYARLGGHRTQAVAHGAANARRAEHVQLRLQLSAAARRALRRHGELKLRLVLHHSRLRAAPALTLTLRSAR
jgi:hypothetical protein